MNDNLKNKLIGIRRAIHAHPELGFREYKTAGLVKQQLSELNIPFEPVAKTGILGTLTKGAGSVIVLRADMDALPLAEQSGLEFSSKEANIMHACGHDLHTVMLIGAAHLLAEREFAGTIKFVFQPSEEGVAESPEFGKSGGQLVMESGKLAHAHAAFGLHVHPLMPVGVIGYKNGIALAAKTSFNIEITAAGGHMAAKNATSDVLSAASEMISWANKYIAENFEKSEGAVGFTWLKTDGEPTYNTMPNRLLLQGTFRILDSDALYKAKAEFSQMAGHLAAAKGIQIDLQYKSDYPALITDAVIHGRLLPAIEKVFGKEKIITGDAQLAAEDFAFYAREIPAQFYFLGANSPGNKTHFLHDPEVVFNEDCIPYGANVLAEGALELLK
jgi:amidohydrolase